MANRFLTINEVNELWAKVIRKATRGLTLKQQRAFFYDLQTMTGGFPRIESKRKRYIETGSE